MSTNWIVSKAALVYVEFFRNVPLLVQLFFWFYIVLALPQVREGYVIFDGAVHQQRRHIHTYVRAQLKCRRRDMDWPSLMLCNGRNRRPSLGLTGGRSKPGRHPIRYWGEWR